MVCGKELLYLPLLEAAECIGTSCPFFKESHG